MVGKDQGKVDYDDGKGNANVQTDTPSKAIQKR